MGAYFGSARSLNYGSGSLATILVCGGRDFIDYGLIDRELCEILDIGSGTPHIIIQGGAKGADFLAKVFAHEYQLECVEYPANWKAYGKRAGHIRNAQMLEEGKPDLVIAFPGGNGTEDMVNKATNAGVRVIEIG